MRRIVTGIVALVGVAGAAAAVAQGSGRGDADGPFRGGRGDRPMMSPSDREAFADARIAALKAGLKLTADQDKLWPPVEDALRGLAKQRAEARNARRERWASMRDDDRGDIPGQLRYMADRQAASADALRRLADASAPLYASLDEGQRRRMQVLARFMRPGAGMHRGGGHEGRMRRGALEGRTRGFRGRRASGPRADRAVASGWSRACRSATRSILWLAPLLQDQARALAGRHDVLAQIRQVDAGPQPFGKVDRLLLRERRVFSEVGQRVPERRVPEPEETVQVPAVQVLLVGIEIDRKVEEIRHEGDRGAIARQPRRLQDVQPFDDEDIRAARRSSAPPARRRRRGASRAVRGRRACRP